MKTGRSLAEIATELERQYETRKDFIAPQAKLEAVVVGNDVRIEGLPDTPPLAVTPHAHSQLATHLGIPQAYYDRLLGEQPDLLTKNINTWFDADAENKRMIRTLDGQVRAVLSPKYRPLDNFDLAQVVLPKLMDLGVQVASAELTPTRFYIKGFLPRLSDELPEGLAFGTGHAAVGTRDRGKVVAAIVISNSEVGAGTLRVEPSVFTTWCTNLAIMKAASMKKYHVGRAFEADANLEVFRDETRAADDKAFFLKVADITDAAFNENVFRAAVAQLREAADTPIKSDDLPAVVEQAVKTLALPKATSNGILKFLAQGGDLTQWGLSSAVTRVANDYDTYQGATDLEHAGGEILALAKMDWERISNATVKSLSA